MSTSAWEHRNKQPLGAGLSSEQLEFLYAKDRSIEQDFWRFDKENPHIYRMIVNLARTARAAGHKSYSLKTIFELIRWHHEVTLKSQEPFKLNNNHTSRYARLVMDREPDLVDFFELRKLRTKAKE